MLVVGYRSPVNMARRLIAALIIGTVVVGGCVESPAAAPSIAAAGPTGPIGPIEEARVVRVVDGDTIVVDRGRGDERVRYIGIDAPETVRSDSPAEWMGPGASVANEALVADREVVLEKDVTEVDRFDRLLRYVWVSEPDGRWAMVNLALVERGFANVSTFPPNVRYADELLAAERRARDAGVGLWGTGPP